MDFFAHSPKEDCPAQSYAEHIKGGVRSRGVLEYALSYAYDISKYIQHDDDKDSIIKIIKNAVLYHDLGKLHSQNQELLSVKSDKKKLPYNHTDAGAAYLFKYGKILEMLLVYSHHKGYIDLAEEGKKEDLAFRVPEAAKETNKFLDEFIMIHNKLVENIPLAQHNEPMFFKEEQSVYLRLLLSCLVDADHSDTATHYGNYPANYQQMQLRPKERLELLDKYIAKKPSTDPRNKLRNEMYVTCKDAEIEGNISSCDSPVGSGKTTAIMAHLLRQAMKRKLRRIFVILPFTNIIKQSVDIYRESLVLPGENPVDIIAEIHHRADFESEDIRHLSVLWRAPIVVTTAVAFFETLASNKTSTLRRLHELPGSAIFIDESHAALPVRLLPIAWKWINIYAENWGCYWVLASGSLARFWEVREIAGEYCANIPEILNDQLRSSLSSYEENRIEYKSDLIPKRLEQLVEWIIKFNGPRLLIVNTVQSAAVIADYICQEYGRERVEHLSTALTPNDRERTLTQVMIRLQNHDDQDWILVATSCVEAGINLSFKVGFRELGSTTSLLQASGRVNREGKEQFAEMWTFCLAEENMLKSNPDLKDAKEVLRGYFNNEVIISPQMSTKSIKDEIRRKGISGQYKQLIKFESEQSFSSVEQNFSVIDSDTRTAIVDEKTVKQLQYSKLDWKILQKNSVQIEMYKLREFKLPAISENLYYWNLEYNSFIGYMAGVIEHEKTKKSMLLM